MYRLIRPLLFRLDPETAHILTLYALRFASIIPLLNWAIAKAFATPPKPVNAFGLTFRNPVGLAAGYDKDAVAVRGLAALGFGHIEVGTVTPRPQEGNPRPRVFRLVEDQAVINRMGFPGKGAEYVALSLRGSQRRHLHPVRAGSPPGRDGLPHTCPGAARQGKCLGVQVSNPRAGEEIASPSSQARNDTKVVIGVNLGKNKDTLLENAAEDYLLLMRTFASLADYIAINVSSPNTVGLRRLQGRDLLEKLLSQIAVERGAWSVKRPILVKLAPDLSDEELDDAIDAILHTGMDGVIATNTTQGREGLRSRHREETGGLSGSPLRVRSEAVLRKVVKRVEGRIPVVSVGGIMSPEDAKRRQDMGAALVQVYTGLVYAGPGLVQKIIRAV
jgi:dihydroorotate dehydrogenase